MPVIELTTTILLVLLPAAVLIREWKVSDGPTRRRHQVTRAVLVAWSLASVCAVALLWGTSKRADRLRGHVDELLAQQEPVSDRVESLRAEKEELARQIAELQAALDEPAPERGPAPPQAPAPGVVPAPIAPEVPTPAGDPPQPGPAPEPVAPPQPEAPPSDVLPAPVTPHPSP